MSDLKLFRVRVWDRKTLTFEVEAQDADEAKALVEESDDPIEEFDPELTDCDWYVEEVEEAND